MGLFMAMTLAFGNLVYLYLGVAFIQMLKVLVTRTVLIGSIICTCIIVTNIPRARLATSQAFTPVITMACAFIVGLEVPHFKLVLSVLIIASGVATASYGAINFSAMGLFIMFLSELTESIRLIMTQMLLQGYKFNASM